MPHRVPMDELAELEARMKFRDDENASTINELRQEIAALKKDIADLMEILSTFKGLARAAKAAENFAVFLAKIAAAMGIVYAVWKWGISETMDALKAGSK